MTLSNLIVFSDEITRYADQRRTVDDAVWLSFNKAFNTISQRILLTKLVNYSLDVQTNRCNSCLESEVQRVAMNGFSSTGIWVPTHFLRCCLGAFLNIFLSDMEVEMESTLFRFLDYTKVMCTIETLEGCCSEWWRQAGGMAWQNLTKQRMDKCTWHRLSPEQGRLEADRLGSSSAEQDLVILVGSWLTMSQKCVLGVIKAKKITSFSLLEILATFRRDRNYWTGMFSHFAGSIFCRWANTRETTHLPSSAHKCSHWSIKWEQKLLD